ncbi:MAG: hypothetical protein A2161_06520 [Candidatus Schekmanbacteria bacterium RBG_13_48_7]|uniref:FAD-binding FR-type domain-containing protein n=1 Tax=Candidatus Schekmanbacteria bacterium RBG_13_48_7 TaxID=1817878 RepID=A0A1F7S592_9BACT|nr:MAG: hypothetical protein A2161_06520 [Candidatus Schekmanbacteria bacterium RBG_13_48_7]
MLPGIILYNRRITVDTLRMGIAADDKFKARPGQFIMMRCSTTMDPLLRRPFSILSIRESETQRNFEILYRIVGTGTQRMADMKEGDKADFLGPFGTGFQIRDNCENWLIAGGIGVPPIYFLAEELKKMGEPKENVRIYFGSKTFEELYCIKDLEKIDYPLIISTDDSSYGESGFISNPLVKTLDEYLRAKKPMPVIYACGPDGLLQVLARTAELYDIEIQMSLETRMGCGLGICQGCAIKMKKGDSDFEYIRACVEGPVFDARRIVWL